MCQMSETWTTSQGIPQRSERSALSSSELGINVDYFVKNCWYLKGSKENINRRLLTAAGKSNNSFIILIGLDVNSQSAKVTWPIFLDLYCTFVGGLVEKSQLIRFWQKFFDEL